jgi:hypothetical protein
MTMTIICPKHRKIIREIKSLRAVWRDLNEASRSARDGRDVDNMGARLSAMERTLFEGARLTYHESTGPLFAQYSTCPACIAAGAKSIKGDLA